MIKDFLKRNWFILASLIYIISPIDILPEFLAPLGIIDDFGVLLSTVLFTVAREIQDRKPKKDKTN